MRIAYAALQKYNTGQRFLLTLRDGVFLEGSIAMLPSELAPYLDTGCKPKLCLGAAYK